MWRYWLVVVILLAISCGKKRPGFQDWPASVIQFENLSDEQKSLISNSLADFNTLAGKKILDLEGTSEGYPITFVLVDPPADSKTRAGYAIHSEESCRIEISRFLFDQAHTEYVESVVLHEVGHCAGLDHTAIPGSVMYPTTARFSSYKPETLTEFVNSVFSSIHLE